ncbi:MAG: TetR/AcrR family transcriptional regulator [Sulfitobacter sp.]
MSATPTRQRGSREIWLNAAYEMLISDGIEAVKVMALAKRLNLSRTGFYWFFKDIAELQGAMIQMWEEKNTGILLARCGLPAGNICQALFHLMDCWLDPALFDAPLDLAIRNWARNDADLQHRVSAADRQRIKALSEMFARHGFSPEQADVRGMTVIYTQIGYISMQVSEAPAERHARVQQYVELFAGMRPDAGDVAAFLARHRG